MTRYIVRVEGRPEPMLVEIVDGQVRVDGQLVPLRVAQGGNGDGRLLAYSGDESHVVDVVDKGGDRYEVIAAFATASLTIREERDTWLGTGGSAAAEGVVTVAMPGKVVAIDVAPGQDVSRGDRLLVIEAMKMENDVKSPMNGRVAAVRVRPGDAVEAGQPLVELE